MKKACILALLCVSSATPGVAAAYDMRDYYPLNMGDSRTYHEVLRRTDPASGQTSYWSDVETETITGTETVQGIATLQRSFIFPSPNPNDQEYDNMAWQADGLKIVGHRETFDNVTFVSTCTTPITLLPLEMELGGTYASSFSCEDGAFSASVSRTLDAVETVTVEAGTFTNCLRSHWTASGPGYSEEATDWHCPGVGLVKSVGTSQEEGEDAPEIYTTTLRWASIGSNGNTVQYGEGEQSIGDIQTAYVSAGFFDNRMQINDILVGGTPIGVDFVLNPATLFFAFQDGSQPQAAIPGIDLSRAYIRMNGPDLTIFDVAVNGVNYFTDWTLVSSPSLGFQLTNFGAMP
ncbi:MAG: hypothetical protein ACOY3Z_12515 [Thermodesulfobacteriota bacterium]